MRPPSRCEWRLRCGLVSTAFVTSLALTSSTLLAPGTGLAKEKAFRSAGEQILRAPAVLSMAPLRLPEGFSPRPETNAEFESLLVAQLATRGFRIVPSDSMERAETAQIDSIGGLYDRVTGKKDAAKVEALRRRVTQMARGWGAAGVLRPEVVFATAHFEGKTAKWDGAKEKGGEEAPVISQLFGYQIVGSMQAISLKISIHDLDGATLYEYAGGIELVSRVKDHRWIEKPSIELLRDRERNARSVQLALGPLME